MLGIGGVGRASFDEEFSGTLRIRTEPFHGMDKCPTFMQVIDLIGEVRVLPGPPFAFCAPLISTG